MFTKKIQLIRILLSKRGRNLLKKISSNTITINLHNAVLLRNLIMEELKFQNNLFQSLRIIKEGNSKNTLNLIKSYIETQQALGKDLWIVKEKLLEANCNSKNNNKILGLEFYSKQLENLEKFAKTRRERHPSLFSKLKYLSLVKDLESKSKLIGDQLSKNNQSHTVKIRLNYKHYKNLTDITKTIVKQ